MMNWETGKAYACRCADPGARQRSSSGGIYPLIAGEILRRGGVVYAVRYEGTEQHIAYCRVTDPADLEATRGSKYAAAVPSGIFAKAARDLKEDREVFFVGTPCGCAGLLAYLAQRGIGREHLLCMDFVCHGVPSDQIWQSYLSEAVPDKAKITGVNMRDKSNGWIEYSVRIDAGDDSVLSSRRENAYIRAFVGNLDLRPSCYACPFKGLERPTDLTLGDYWGVQRFAPDSYDPEGVSLLLLHTGKGAAYLAAAGDRILAEDAMIREAVQSNPCIVRSSTRPPKREAFLKMLREGVPFEKAAEQALHKSLTERVSGKLSKLRRGSSGKAPAGGGQELMKVTRSGNRLKISPDKVPVLYDKKEECCGCAACEQICPAGAIRMVPDEDGFVYPQISMQACIGCRRCVSACPMQEAQGWH